MRFKLADEDKEKLKSILESLEVIDIDVNIDVSIKILPKLKPKNLKDDIVDITGKVIKPLKKGRDKDGK